MAKTDRQEHEFSSDHLARKYRDLRADGHAPDVAAVQVLRDEYKSRRAAVKTHEETCDALKKRAKEITGGERLELPDGRFRPHPYSGSGVKDVDELREKHPGVYEKFVYTYSGSSWTFD